MKTVSLTLYVLVGLVAGFTVNSLSQGAISGNTATEAVNRVFAQYPKDQKKTWPISGHALYTPVRPLQQSTFVPLRQYFSGRQQRNVDQFLRALGDLINERDRLAKKLDIREKWWPTGVDLLKVDGVLSRDLLTGRTDNPDKISILAPKAADGKLEAIIQEAYMEHGQDRVLGRGHRTSIVTLIPEKDRWVIDEIQTTTTDAYGETTTETLTQRLRNAVKPLLAAEREIKKLPQALEIKKGSKAKN